MDLHKFNEYKYMMAVNIFTRAPESRPWLSPKGLEEMSLLRWPTLLADKSLKVYNEVIGMRNSYN